jgi:hypothetical protein
MPPDTDQEVSSTTIWAGIDRRLPGDGLLR